MASSSSQNVSENLNVKEPSLCLAIEQPPVMISVTKCSKPDTRLQAPGAIEGVSDEMFRIPLNCYENLFVERVAEGSRNIFWSAPIDFKLPEDSMDRILKRDENVKSTYGVQHLPLAERLGGWKIEKRQRPGLKIYDKYFYHNQSGKMFRTFRQVVRFIKDASLPRKAPQRNFAQNQGLMALETPGSEPSQKRRRGENLQHHDKQKETGKGKENEKGSSSSEEVTPHSTPKRGRECLRRLNNGECNLSQGVKENARNEESQVEGGSISRFSDKTEPEFNRKTIIPDLVGLEDFGYACEQ